MPNSLPTLFCPHCETYLGPLTSTCFCGWQRPATERLAQPGQPLWQASLGGPARGRAVIAGELVLFAWGNRQAGGGVTAFNRLSGALAWKTETSHAVEGGLAVTEDKVLFGTLGFMRQDAELCCHSLKDGSVLWRKPVSGGIWGAPVTREARVYAGCDDGQVHCFDLYTGESVARWPVTFPAGRLWLTLADSALYVISQTGSVFELSPFNASKAEIANLKDEVKAGLVFGAGRVFAGTTSGKVYAIRRAEKNPKTLLDNCAGVVSAPVFESGTLYVGSADHRLHALDVESGRERWQADCVRRIVSSPVVADGLVYIGAENGAVYALPWHLGNYALAAKRLVGENKSAEAARYFAIASELETRDLAGKENLCEAALSHWQKAGQRRLAASFRESLLGQDPLTLAREYEEAGKLSQDASLLRRATEYYEDAEDPEGVKRCNQMAGKLSRAPYLSVHLVNLPPNWEAGEEGDVYFDIKNRGASPARNIRIRLAGNLTMSLWADFDGVLPPGERAEVAARIRPTGPGSLVIEPHFTDGNDKKWSETRHFPFEDVQPSRVTLEVGGDVGALMLDDRALQGKIRIRGDAGLIQVKSVQAETKNLLFCPACGKMVQESGKRCQDCGAILSSAKGD